MRFVTVRMKSLALSAAMVLLLGAGTLFADIAGAE